MRFFRFIFKRFSMSIFLSSVAAGSPPSRNSQRTGSGACSSLVFKMNYYFEKLSKFLDGGDPAVKKWFLIENDYLPFALSITYVLISTIIGPALMRNRKPFTLRKTLIVFNFSLVAVYGICLALFLRYAPHITYEFFCEDNIIVEGTAIYKIACLSHSLYITKYVEFLDTLFFILRKKQNQVSVLHVTHHALLPFLCWLISRTEKGGLQTIPLMLNAFVHIVMYLYYGLAAIGPEVRKRLWWKKYITQLQILQFLIIIILMTIVVPVTGCKVGIFTYVTNILFVPMLLYLFYDFYKREYQSKSKTKGAVMNGKKIENGAANHYLSSNEKYE